MVVDSLKKFAAALGYGAVSDYKGETIQDVLKELAVKMECAPSTEDIKAEGVAEILDFIADNKGEEEKEPYDLVVTATGATVKVTRKHKELEPAADILYNGDKLTITATPDEGHEISSLTVNGVDFTSGETHTVSGKVTIACTAAES